MNRALQKCLSAASLVFVMLAFFPLLPLLFGCMYHLSIGMKFDCISKSVGVLLQEYAYCVISGAIGYGTSWYFGDKRQWMPVKRKIGSMPFAGLLAGGAFAVMAANGFFADAILLALAVIVFFIMGHTAYSFAYSEVITWKRYVLSVGVAAGVMLALRLAAKNPFGVMVFAVIAVFETCLVFFGMNQSNIDFMMQRRKHRMDSLPQKIRSYNLLLLGGILAVVIVLFLLHKPIGYVLAWVGSGLLALAKLLLRLLGKLLFGGSNSGGSVMSEDPFLDIPDKQGTSDGSSGSWVWIAVTGLLAAFILFFIWYNRRAISNFFKTVRKKLTRWLQHLLFDGRTRVREDATDFYSEIDENVLPEEEISNLEDERKTLTWNAWRKAYRKFMGMPENDTKYRCGYRLVIEWLKTQGVEIAADATTLDICRLSREKSRIYPDLSGHTANYNNLRYGEQPFTLDSLEGLKKALHIMSQLKPAN